MSVSITESVDDFLSSLVAAPPHGAPGDPGVSDITNLPSAVTPLTPLSEASPLLVSSPALDRVAAYTVREPALAPVLTPTTLGEDMLPPPARPAPPLSSTASFQPAHLNARLVEVPGACSTPPSDGADAAAAVAALERALDLPGMQICVFACLLACLRACRLRACMPSHLPLRALRQMGIFVRELL